MQILSIWTNIALWILNGIFKTAGRFYDILIQMTTDESIINADILQKAQDNIYLLMGIFMLFRLAISLINMLIDPEKSSDKQVGAGKLITRILISIILLLTMNSLIFPLSRKLQTAIINPSDGSGSIFVRLFDANVSENINSDIPNESGLTDNGLRFVNQIATSFFTCIDPDHIQNPNLDGLTCQQKLDGYLSSTDYNKHVEFLWGRDDIEGDGFTAILFGLALMVFLVVLMVEVAVRTFKLILLQFISPVAAISYINPNDKIFSAWFKQWIGCYLDLFFKLMAISLLALLIGAIDLKGQGLMKIIWIFGLLTFAKTVPNLISKIFGLDELAGTMGASLGLLKKGAGFVTGAAVGGIGGLISGAGKGGRLSTVVGGAIGGTFRGGMGGAQGDALKGYKDQAARNRKARDSNIAGGSWGQRILSKGGMDKATRTDRKVKTQEDQIKTYDDFTKYQDKMEEIAESSDFMKTLRADNANSGQFSETEIKNARSQWIRNQLTGHGTDAIAMVGTNGMTTTRSSFVEAGKKSGLESTMKEAALFKANYDDIKNVRGEHGYPGAISVTDFDSLEANTKAVKYSRTGVQEKVNEQKFSEKYRRGAASRETQK